MGDRRDHHPFEEVAIAEIALSTCIFAGIPN
jgi:hypothetical protein